MAVLILDSEALSSLARPQENPGRLALVIDSMTVAASRRIPIRVPSAVLAEVMRGRGYDEPIEAVLNRGSVGVVTTGRRIARRAGHLLADIGAGSEMAIDAFVVATCLRLGGGVVLTHDPDDMTLLAASHPNVTVAPI